MTRRRPRRRPVARRLDRLGPTDPLVPFASLWRPAPSLGVTAMYLAVAASS
jgi:hypothetical protein